MKLDDLAVDDEADVGDGADKRLLGRKNRFK